MLNFISKEKKLEKFHSQYLETKDLVRYTIYYILKSNIRTNPVEETNELVQDVFLKAWDKYSKFQNKSSFKTWIYKIAKNIAIDFIKKHNKYYIATNKLDLKEEIKENKSDIINEGIKSLGEKHKEIFTLFYLQEHSIQEISELLNIAEGTIKSRLFYAKNIFKKYLIKKELYNG